MGNHLTCCADGREGHNGRNGYNHDWMVEVPPPSYDLEVPELPPPSYHDAVFGPDNNNMGDDYNGDYDYHAL
jgi:hypothetical protein